MRFWLPVTSLLLAMCACTPPSTPVPHYIAVASGFQQACAVRTDGTLWCWGSWLKTTDRAVPAQVGSAVNWADVVVGFHQTCGLKTDGSIWCWQDVAIPGASDFPAPNDVQPIAVTFPSGSPPIKTLVHGVAAQACGLDSNGALWCWGANTFGEVGIGNRSAVAVPAQVSGGPWATATISGEDTDETGLNPEAVGAAHTCGVTTKGAVFCWGSNYYGQLGMAAQFNSAGSAIPSPAAASTSASAWTFLSSGLVATAAIAADGTLWSWGHQLKNPSDVDQWAPGELSPETTWKSISTGDLLGCGLQTGGSAWCWGTGYLGNGGETFSQTPLAVNDTHTWTAISVGLLVACAIASDQTLWCWGTNDAGTVGDGTLDDRDLPTQVSAG